MSGLGEIDWLAIEQLNDMIFSVGDSDNTLFSVLEVVLQKLNCSYGALYLPGHGRYELSARSVATENEWVEWNAPACWRQACLDDNSQLSGLIRRSLYQATPMPGIEALQLGAILPLSSPDGVIGVMMVSAAPLPAESVRWQAYLRALARIVSLHRMRSEPKPLQALSDPKEAEVLRILAEAQNTIHDPDKMALHMAAGIRDVFQAEDAILVLLDEESSNLAICKRVGMRTSKEWFSQYSVRLGGRMAQWMESAYHALTMDDIYAQELEMIFRNETDLQVEAITCSPLKGNSGRSVGALILVNPPMRTLDNEQPRLLATAASGLANLVHTSRLITLLRISNADLEALRWELVNSRNTLRALFDSLPSSIYIVDQVYNLVAINASRSARINQHPSALVGRKCYEKLYGRLEPCKGCMVAETLRTGHNLQWSNREWGNDDTYREWEVNTFSVRESTEKAFRAIVVEDDVTTRRTMETSLAQFEKMAGIGQLATGIAQEMHDPLTAILANAQILKHSMPGNQVDSLDSVHLIETAGKQILHVIRNLLGIAQRGRYEFLPFNLNETIVNASSLVQHELKSRQVNLRLALEENMPSISISKDHLQEVWVNLILTAVESMDKESKWIEICSYYENGWYHVSLQDNGKGMAAERVEKLFEPQASGRKTGLNLYSDGMNRCKKIIRQHGGNIQVESQPGEWTRFTITLPAQSEVVVRSEPMRSEPMRSEPTRSEPMKERVGSDRNRIREYELSGIR